MSTALTTLEQVVKIVEPLPIHATFPPEFQHFRSRFKKSTKKFIFGKVKLRNRVSHAASTRFSTQSLPVWTVSILAVACSCRMCRATIVRQKSGAKSEYSKQKMRCVYGVR